MYNPDLNEKKELREAPKPTQVGHIRTASEQEIFEKYLDDYKGTRLNHGIGKEDGVYFMADKSKVDRLDPLCKEWLRQWVQGKIAKRQWKNASPQASQSILVSTEASSVPAPQPSPQQCPLAELLAPLTEPA